MEHLKESIKDGDFQTEATGRSSHEWQRWGATTWGTNNNNNNNNKRKEMQKEQHVHPIEFSYRRH